MNCSALLTIIYRHSSWFEPLFFRALIEGKPEVALMAIAGVPRAEISIFTITDRS